jgi:predicted AAA+ superfamily ATPase
MAYQRNEAASLRIRLDERAKHITIVAGPRQVGKTTLVKDALRDRPNLYIAVDQPAEDPDPLIFTSAAQTSSKATSPRDGEWLVGEWQRARIKAKEGKDSDKGFVLALDEIQKIPRWSEVVKGLWDADRASGLNMHVVLLGSSPLLMQQGLTESLAGRYELIRATHWSYLEMHEAFDFDLDQFLYFGGYPGSAPFIRDEPRWRAFLRSGLIEPNIERDILMMTRVDKPALLKRLFQLGCDYSGQILAYTKMLGQLDDEKGHTVTLAHYLDLLSNAGLLTGLQKYSGKRIRQRASSPKLIPLNTALMTSTSGYGYDEARADRTYWGRVVESAVGAHLYNTGHPDCEVYYWRESPHEVDFVLARGNRLAAIEVKSGTAPSHAPGLNAFAAKYKTHRLLIVGEGGIPLVEFLSYPAEHWLA